MKDERKNEDKEPPPPPAVEGETSTSRNICSLKLEVRDHKITIYRSSNTCSYQTPESVKHLNSLVAC